MNIKAIIEEMQTGQMNQAKLLEYANHSNTTLQANAIATLAKCYGKDRDVLQFIQEKIQQPNSGAVLMGTVRLTHWMVGCLYQIGTEEATQIFKDLVQKWAPEDQKDLFWYLKTNVDGFKQEDIELL